MPEPGAFEPCEQGPLLSALLDDELDAAERDWATAHIDRCAACRDELADLRRVRSQVRSLPVRELPPGLLSAASSAAAGTGAREDRRRAERLAIAGLLVAAAAVGALTWGTDDAPARTVEVPVEAFVNDHVVRTGAGPLLTPVVTGE